MGIIGGTARVYKVVFGCGQKGGENKGRWVISAVGNHRKYRKSSKKVSG